MSHFKKPPDENGLRAYVCACCWKPPSRTLVSRIDTSTLVLLSGRDFRLSLPGRFGWLLLLCIHMLDTFNIWLWFSVAFLQLHFAAMLSLDFLDDVRRMNKRQVGNTGSFHRTLLLLLCMSTKLTLAAMCALMRNNVSLVRVLSHKLHFSQRAFISVKYSKHKYTRRVL